MTEMAMRIAVENRPGALASVAAALGELGANIVDVDVHEMGERVVVDEVVLDAPAPVTPEQIRLALLARGATSVVSLPLFHRTTDAQVRCLAAATELLQDGIEEAAAIESALRELMPVDGVTVENASDHPAAREAVAQGVPVAVHEAADGRWAVALEVPGDGRERLTVTLQRARVRFSATEIARARALLQLAAMASSLRRKAADPRAA